MQPVVFIAVQNVLGFNWAMAAIRFRSTTGGSSNVCSQPTGGLDGGDIRNSLSGLGGCKNPSGFDPRNIIGFRKENKIKFELFFLVRKLTEAK